MDDFNFMSSGLPKISWRIGIINHIFRTAVMYGNSGVTISEIRGSLFDAGGSVIGSAESVLVTNLAPKQSVWLNRDQLSEFVGAEWLGEALLEVNDVDGLKLLNLNDITSGATFSNFSCFEDSTSGGAYLQTTSAIQNVSLTHLVNTSENAQQFVGTLYNGASVTSGSYLALVKVNLKHRSSIENLHSHAVMPQNLAVFNYYLQGCFRCSRNKSQRMLLRYSEY
jgi:hypothetical protein